MSSLPLPHAVKRSSTGGAAVGSNNGGAEAIPVPIPTPSAQLTPPSQSETVKEKEQVKLSPLHQALLDCVKARPGIHCLATVVVRTMELRFVHVYVPPYLIVIATRVALL